MTPQEALDRLQETLGPLIDPIGERIAKSIPDPASFLFASFGYGLLAFCLVFIIAGAVHAQNGARHYRRLVELKEAEREDREDAKWRTKI
jgi:hypothetical protein